MATKQQVQSALTKIRSSDSFFQGLLAETLNWPIDQGVIQLDDIAHAWTNEELRAAGLERNILDGQIWQIQPLPKDQQPWGIFLLQFNTPDVFASGRGITSPLRQILRGLVPSRRKAASLPSWERENILFICTHQWEHFRFGHFRSTGEGLRRARLATFGWGPNTSTRTVCEFNLPPLSWPEITADAKAWVAQWSGAFDKEPLTADFFKRFDRAIQAIKSDLEANQSLSPAEAYTRSQLLLERLIFLYFLQNRGWLNQESRFLLGRFQKHRDRPDEFSYALEFLDKLFWTLSSAPGSPARLDGIPFLNGGLFDDDEFAQTPIRMKTNPPLKVRNSTFAKVFEALLEAFNFTVCEDTPLNQEVAVDPEMLGKVFESIVLHAEAADPDAVAPDKRKATGSYYTPRIVVHFICREALLQYLLARLPGDNWGARLKQIMDIDASDGVGEDELKILRGLLSPTEAGALRDLLRTPKCCDPAVGSGAFPVGLLHELVNVRRVVEAAANGYVDPVRKDGTAWLQQVKADIVQNCLYGVDIQQQAIEICRLRLWLSLVVEYDLGLDPFTAERTQFARAIEHISQLPNLEMNFRRGDSLHDHICGVPVIVDPGYLSAYLKEYEGIYKLGMDLHNAKTAKRKRTLRIKVLQKRLELSEQVLNEELKQLQSQDGTIASNWFGESESESAKRKRIEHEIEQLQEAQKEVAADRKALKKLAGQPYDNRFYPDLRRLEGADFDSPFNFAWRIDFPAIFAPKPTPVSALSGEFSLVNQAGNQQELPGPVAVSPNTLFGKGGFDIIVGNPPFVTARNPKKRELWRARWKRVCHSNYSLVCPFFDLGFGLLTSDGQLGFIVSNAFAKREFGKPLLENFFPTVDVQKVLDCSGLMFPGHGTPTCIVFGRNEKPDLKSSIRVSAILPGGGDLRTPPEESPLWTTLAQHHDQPGFMDSRIVVADRSRGSMAKWPWNFDPGNEPTRRLIESDSHICLSAFVDEPVGHVAITRTDEVFILPEHLARRARIELRHLKFLGTGETIRNWSPLSYPLIVFPYEDNLRPLNPENSPQCVKYLKPFRSALENVVMHGSVRKKETNVEWFEYSRLARPKFRVRKSIVLPEIATHNHALVDEGVAIFHQTVPVVKLPGPAPDCDYHLLAALLNSSAALFWLKQVCFNKAAGEDEHRDRFVYAGGKVQQLPVPEVAAKALRGQSHPLAERLTELSRECWERGRQLPTLSMKKLFEKPREAYYEWNASLPGYVAPHLGIAKPFETAEDLRAVFNRAVTVRETLRAEMIARQEEIDWLVYEGYGLITNVAAHLADSDLSLSREERPFCLWLRAEDDFHKAVSLIPPHWSSDRRSLWQARLAAIRDNEHIRRIEQPVYKRRWDEQWKVGGSWACGDVAYAAEFRDAFRWWLAEKAEWHLEKNAQGGPISQESWISAIFADARVRAAFEVNTEIGVDNAKDARPFAKVYKEIVDGDTVPEGIPLAVSWEDLEKQGVRVPSKVKTLRGKLNVPRERFRLRGKDQFLWAGLEWKDKST